MRTASLLVALAGCGSGPNPETVIDELRVVAAVADPPEVAPGEPFELSLVVADPLGEGGDVLVWSCGEEGPCDTALAPLDEELHLSWTATAPVPVWMLACAPELCGDLTEVPERALRDPSEWLADLPLSGVSAAFRTTRIDDGAGPPAANPDLVEAPAQGPSGESASLSFLAPGAQAAYGYATTGGFTRPRYDVASDGAVTLEWVAGPEPGPGRVYVVFEDEAGGTAVWAADAESR